MKSFLISIDTEGDNQWAWKPGKTISTENALFLPRFQLLCEQYGFIPTYLTNFEMAQDIRFQKFAHEFLSKETGEIGMHLHAWSTKPDYRLSVENNYGAPFLIEFPEEIMESKIKYLTGLLSDIFQTKIITHRAGRWTMNDLYFEMLSRNGYIVDCSVTPHIDWSTTLGATTNSKGSDYRLSNEEPYLINDLIEVPVTIRVTNKVFLPQNKSLKSSFSSLYSACKGQIVWLRPTCNNLDQMVWLIDSVASSKTTDYIMFMLHSSELMPGGSPYFRTQESIEMLYKQLDYIFKKASEKFIGQSIGDYGTRKREALVLQSK